MDEPNGGWKPPYFAFQTFWAFLDELASKPLPPQVDRTLLKSKSGTDQASLLLALRSFDLVNDENVVNASTLPPLAQGDEESRIKALGDLVRRHYGNALALSAQSGTEGQLHELFRDQFGLTSPETRRKAETFFLHAARKAGIELSPHFPSTRGGAGGANGGAGGLRPKRPATRAKRTSAEHGSPGAPIVTSETTAVGEHKRVSFGDAGVVNVTVEVKWLDLPDAVFTGLRQVIRDLEALGSKDVPAAPASESNDDRGGAS